MNARSWPFYFGSEMPENYPALTVTHRTGKEPLHRNGQPSGANLLDFWRWAYSDLANNAQRGVLAEFIVARALEVADSVRREWDACDLTSSSQLRIEVKSAAFLQSWSQKKLSSISFDIRPTYCFQEDNSLSTERVRQSDIYIFCLLHHKDKATLDPLDLDQWCFYIVPTSLLNEKFREQKTLRLSGVMKLEPQCVHFDEISQAVQNIVGAPHLTTQIVIE